MQNAGLQNIFSPLIETFGEERGGRIFSIIRQMGERSLSHQNELCHVVLERFNGGNGNYLEQELLNFGKSSVYRGYLYPDITYCSYIKPVFTYALVFSRKMSAMLYPDFPLKSIFEPKRVNLSQLDDELIELLGEHTGQTFESSTDLFYLFAEAAFQYKGKQQLISKTLQYFISGLTMPGEGSKYFYLLMKIILFFHFYRNLPLSPAVEKIRVLLNTRGIEPKEIIFILYDFYIDNRYKAEHLNVILSLITACVKTFYPQRKALIPKILHLLKDFIRISGVQGSRYTKTVFDLFIKNPYIDLTEWVEEGARIIREHGDDSKSAEAYFSRESDLSNRIWKRIDSGIHFDQVYRRMQFFANAITERPITLKNNESVPLWQNYHLFYTDGNAVFVPQYVNYQKDREKNFTMMLHCVAHECAHIEFGSFRENRDRYRRARSVFNRLFPGEFERNRSRLQDYLVKVKSMLDEMGYDVRIIQPKPDSSSYLTRLLFHVPFPHIFAGIWNIIEDYRIDTLLYTKYPGYKPEKAFVDSTDYETVPDIGTLDTANNIINGLIQFIRFGKLKGSIHPESEAAFGDIIGIVSKYTISHKTDVYSSLVVACHLYKRLILHFKNEDPSFFKKLERDNTESLLNEEDIIGATNNRNSMLPVEINIMKNRISPKKHEMIERQAKERQQRISMQETLESHAQPELHGEFDRARRLFSYPEWDHRKNCYINDRCILADIPWKEKQNMYSDPLHTKYGSYLPHIRQIFYQLRPRENYKQRGMDDGFEIDFDKYIDCLMDFATGNEMDNNFYISRRRQERSVSAALVLDMSPSTDEIIKDETIFLYEKYATYLLCEALHASGDNFGVFSYFDFGPKAGLFYTLKDFSEIYSREHYRRLAEFKPADDGFSRLAVGLRHILSRMKEEEAKTKIVFFITDGLPFYFEDTVNEGKTSKEFQVDGKRTVVLDYPVPVVSVVAKSKKYIKEDMRKVQEEAAIAGIHLFCITLDPDSVDFMSSIFGNRLIYLPDIPELPKRLLEIFRKVTM